MSPNQNQTQDPTGNAGPPPEFFQEPHWLYDLVMGQIEPDLTTVEIKHLDEKYKGETPKQHKERMAAYDRAFGLCEKALAKVSVHCHTKLEESRRVARGELRKKESREHEQEIADLEQKFTDTGL